MDVTWRTTDAIARLAPASGGLEAWLGSLADAEPERVLTRSRTTDTSLVDVSDFGRIVRKRWRWPGLKERLRGVGRTTALARTPAEREFAALGRTYAETPFHPAPLAARIERQSGVAHRAMLLLEFVDDAVDLARTLRDERDGELRLEILGDLAARVASMHAAGVTDGDCHPRNVLVAGTRTWKVDCGRQRVGRAPARGRRALYDLACIDVGLVAFARDEERSAFFSAYSAISDAAADGEGLAQRVSVFTARIAPDESRRLPTADNE